MTTETQELSLRISHKIAARPEAVFDAWLDPKMLAKFMLPGPDMSVPEAVTDPTEGGRFAIIMRAGDQDMPHAGTYLTIDRPRRLIFTWESAHSVEGSTVTLDFVADGDGTEVTLTHVRFIDAEIRDNHKGGWTGILHALGRVL